MNNELELSEELMNEGFTPFGDIEDLTEEKILNKEMFEYIFSVANNETREDLIISLQLKAKKMKITREFNKKLKIYRERFIKQIKSANKNETQFKDSPYSALKCGQWIANEKGVVKKEYNALMQATVIKASPIPITIVERIINIDANIEKIKLAFLKDGKWQEIIVEKNTIASKNKILQLANRGIEVTDDNAKNLISYLSDLLELNAIETKEGVSHLGWIENDFIPYSDRYSLDVDFEFKQKLGNIKSSGNYEEWKRYIKKLREKSIVLRFMMASSFASVLVKIFNLNTFLVHLWGKSGNGKTVAEMICASIWGKPDGNLISNLSNTAIANERLCNFYRNMPIFLDELQIAKTRYKNFDEFIYILTEGKGKERGTVDNGIRELTTWQNIILLTGEEPITSDTSKEGVKNRVIEINEDSTIIENGNEVVNFIQVNYGFAGQNFIELIDDKEKIKRIYQNYVNELSKTTIYQKQINAFAVILTADYIVSKEIFNDEPIKVVEIESFERKDTDETDRVYDLIRDWVTQNTNKFVQDNYIPTTEIWGEYREDGIYIIATVLKRYLSENNVNFNSVKNKLFEKGYILKNSNGEISGVKKINGTSCRCIQFIMQEDNIGIDDELPF